MRPPASVPLFPAPSGSTAAPALGPSRPSGTGPLSSVSVQVSAQPKRGPIPLPVSLTATAKGSSKVLEYNFTWNFGDGTTPVTQNVSVAAGLSGATSVNHTYTLVGTFQVNVSVNDGVDSVSSAYVSISATLPLTITALALPPTVTSGRPVVLAANASGGSPPYTYLWSGVPSGCVVAGSNLTCVVKMVGTYTVRLEVSDAIPNHAFTNVVFTVNPKLTATATYTSWYHCVGTTDYLTDNFSGAAKGGTPPYSYSWNPGDGGANQSGANISHNFTQATLFNVTLTIVDASGAVANRTLTISTSFVACEVSPPFTSLVSPALIGGVIAAAVVVTVLAMVFLRSHRRPPPKASGPIPVWRETEESGTASWQETPAPAPSGPTPVTPPPVPPPKP